MEIINKRYIKLDKFDIYGRIVKSTNNDEYSSNLLKLMFDYEKNEKCFIREIYLSRDSKKLGRVIDLNNLPIKRNTIKNAIVFAALSDDIEMLKRLNKYIYKNEVYPFEIEDDLLNYILENSIDINEYLEREYTRIIYDEKLNKLEEGYIYQEKELDNIKKLHKNY